MKEQILKIMDSVGLNNSGVLLDGLYNIIETTLNDPESARNTLQEKDITVGNLNQKIIYFNEVCETLNISGYDLNELTRDANYGKIPFPVPVEHHNAKGYGWCEDDLSEHIEYVNSGESLIPVYYRWYVVNLSETCFVDVVKLIDGYYETEQDALTVVNLNDSSTVTVRRIEESVIPKFLYIKLMEMHNSHTIV